LGNSSGARNVLIRRVGAASNETSGELGGPVVLLHGLSELRQGSGKIRSERPVDVGLQFI